MNATVSEILEDLLRRYPSLIECEPSILRAFEALRQTFRMGGKLLCCGNGGSCADCDHIVGELMKSFRFRRELPTQTAKEFLAQTQNGAKLAESLECALPAISLGAHTALISALSNDTDPAIIYAQQVFGLGRKPDALLAISTSGNAANCIFAAETAKVLGLQVIALTGQDGGKLGEIADIAIQVPQRETYLVQELHLPVYHALCAMLELEFFGKENDRTL